MGYPHYDLVQRAHSELIAEGKIRRRTEVEQIENDKGLLTRRSAYYANTERDHDHGILTKTTGNNSEGYSVDIIIDKGGEWWDIASDTNGLATPVNSETHGPDPALAERWAQPTAELAEVDGSGEPGPGPGPGPGDITSNAELMAKLDQALTKLDEVHQRQAMDTAVILERDDYNTQRIMERLEQIVTNAEESGKKILVLWLASQRPGTGEPPLVPPGGELPDGAGLLLLLLKAMTRPDAR